MNDLIATHDEDHIPITSISPEHSVASDGINNQAKIIEEPVDRSQNIISEKEPGNDDLIDTDEEIWKGKRSCDRRQIDLEVITRLLETIKENFDDVMKSTYQEELFLRKLRNPCGIRASK